jgi:hypothetical protein
VLTYFAPFFNDNNAYLSTLFLLKLLEPDGGAEARRAPSDDANIDLIGGTLHRAEIYIFIPSTCR